MWEVVMAKGQWATPEPMSCLERQKQCQQQTLFYWKKSVQKGAQASNVYTTTCKTYTNSTDTHADSEHSKCFRPLPLTQHSSANTHKHIRTHFHTYPQTDTNKWTHTPQCNSCQDKNNVANDLDREKQLDSALCVHMQGLMEKTGKSNDVHGA